MDTPTFSVNELQDAQVVGGSEPTTSSSVFPTFSAKQIQRATAETPAVHTEVPSKFYQTPSEAQQAGDVDWQAFLHIPQSVFEAGKRALTPSEQTSISKGGEPYTSAELEASRAIGYPDSFTNTAQGRMANWGFSAEQTYPHWGTRASGKGPQEYGGWNPIELMLSGSLPANLVKSAYYAPVIEEQKYALVHSYMNAQRVLQNTAKYSPQQIAVAQQIVTNLTGSAKLHPGEAVKNLVKGVSSISGLKEVGKGIVKGILTDPELLLVPGASFGEGVIAKAGSAALAGAGINTAIDVGQQATSERPFNPTETATSALQGGVFGAVTGPFHEEGKVKDFSKSGGSPEAPTPETPTEKAPSGEAKVRKAPPQEKPRFRVNEKGELVPVETSNPESGSVAVAARKAAEKYTKSASPSKDSTAEPPSHSWRVDDTKEVGLTGGVSEDGKTVYLSKEVPSRLEVKTKDGGTSEVNPKPFITTHELVESSIMRHKGPWTSEEIGALRKKMGGALIPKKIYAALTKDGKVSYQQAHYLATLAENHHFDLVHGDVDHNEYQKALGEHIKRARESALANPGETPSDLDEKPYRDAEEQKLVDEGKGKNPDFNDLEKNASDESSASLEAIRRAKSEKSSGQYRFSLNRNGQITPLVGPDAVDVHASHGNVVIQKGIGNTPYTILSHGEDISPIEAQGILNRNLSELDRLSSLGGIDLKDLKGDKERARDRAIQNVLRQSEEGPITLRVGAAISSFRRLLEKGKITPEEFANKVISLHNSMMESSATKRFSFKERARGSDFIRQKLLEAKRRGDLSPEAATFAEWLINKNPNLVDTLGISIRSMDRGISGGYQLIHQVIHLAKDSDNPGTAVHEIMHHTERMMPKAFRSAIMKEYFKDLISRAAKATGSEKLFFDSILNGKGKEAAELIRSGKISYGLYKYTDPSEYWAVKGTDILSERFKATSIFEKIRVWLREFVHHLKSAAGLRSDSPVISALNNLLYRDSGELNSKEVMLGQDSENYLRSAKGSPLVYGAVEKAPATVPDESRLPDEEKVIDDAKQGDVGATEKLFRNYYLRLKNTLAHTSVGEQAIRTAGVSAEDLAQQTFLQAFKNLHSFQGNSEFFTWLYRIGQNEAKQALRGSAGLRRETPIDQSVATHSPDDEGKLTQPLQADISDRETTPESIEEANQTSHLLKKGLSKLSRGQRQVFDLFYLQGLSNQEIAEHLGMPQSTVAALLMRGRDALEQHLKEEGVNYHIPRSQRGAIDSDTLTRLGKFSLIASGAAIGAAYSNNKLEGAWRGALGAFALSLIPLNDSIKAIRDLKNLPKGDFESAKSELFDREGKLAIADRHSRALFNHLKKLVPDPSRRTMLTHWLEGNRSIPLTDKEYEAALLVQATYKQLGKLALQHEVVGKLVDNYVTHIFSKEDQAKIVAYRETNPQKFDAATSSPYGKDRKIPFTLKQISENEKLGVTPKTTDIADILEHYQKSVQTAIINKDFLTSLKERGLVKKSSLSIKGFTYLNLPALKGWQVHQDIAPELNMVMGNYEPGAIGSAVSAVNTAGKISLLSLSLFHMLNIGWLTLSSLNNPLEAIKVLSQSVVKGGKYHAMLKDPKFEDTIDHALKSGLRFQYKPSAEGGINSLDPDYGGNIQQASRWLQRRMDQSIPYSGKAVGAVSSVANKITDVIFGNLATGVNLALWDKYRSGMEFSKAKELGRALTDKEKLEIGRQAAEAVNNTQRSVNWMHAAEDSSNRYIRNLKLGLFSKRGMQGIENTFLAPTWKYGLIRTLTKSFGEGSGWRGLLDPKTTADLQRAFILRAAIIYATVGNAINYATVGRPIWDNKNPFMIDLPDGTHIQWAKSLMELGEGLISPVQTTLNSLSPLASGGAEAVLNKKYLSSAGFSPAITSNTGIKGYTQRAIYPIKKMQPIPIQQAEEYGLKGALRGVAGFSEYGSTKAQSALKRAAAARKAAETRKQERLRRGY